MMMMMVMMMVVMIVTNFMAHNWFIANHCDQRINFVDTFLIDSYLFLFYLTSSDCAEL